MPTPRPTIMAMVGAEVLTSITAASRITPPELMPSPASATPIGSPAPTTEPSARTRISSAASTPMISPYPESGAAALSGTSPPSSTCRPESRVASTASSSGSRLPIRSGSVTGTSYRTSISSVSPSEEGRGAPTART